MKSRHVNNLLKNDSSLRSHKDKDYRHKNACVYGLSYAYCAETYIFLGDIRYSSCSMKKEKEDGNDENKY